MRNVTDDRIKIDKINSIIVEAGRTGIVCLLLKLANRTNSTRMNNLRSMFAIQASNRIRSLVIQSIDEINLIFNTSV